MTIGDTKGPSLDSESDASPPGHAAPVPGSREQGEGLAIPLSSARKRLALEVLKAERLRELVRDAELDVNSMRDRQALIGGLADGRRIEFRRVLAVLSRDELKSMCSALGLSTVGKDKALIVD